MSEVNVFAVVHKALRWASTRALAELGSCAGDLGAIDRALRDTSALLDLHEIHQRVEDAFVIPAIEAKRAGAATRLAGAHLDHADGIAALRARLAGVAEAGASPAVLHDLYLEVSRFVGESYLHMYEEEMLAQPLLAELYTQGELAALVTRARGSLSPAEHRLFEGAMLPAMSAIERQQGVPR